MLISIWFSRLSIHSLVANDVLWVQMKICRQINQFGFKNAFSFSCICWQQTVAETETETQYFVDSFRNENLLSDTIFIKVPRLFYNNLLYSFMDIKMILQLTKNEEKKN